MSSRTQSLVRWLLHTALCLLVAFGNPPLVAQVAEVEKIDVPPPPASWVLDDANLLSKDQAEDLSVHLTTTFEQTGLPTFVVALAYTPMGLTLEKVLAAYAKEWFGDRPGLVCGFERGSGQVSFAPGDGLHELIFLPDQQAIFRGAIQDEDGWKDPAPVFCRVVKRISSEMGTALVDGRARMSGGFKLKSVLWFLPSTILGALLLGLLASRKRPDLPKSGRRASVGVEDSQDEVNSPDGGPPYFFPTTGVAERFGAVYGGGTPMEKELHPPIESTDSGAPFS